MVALNASDKHIALLEQAVNRYTPALWVQVARALRGWLRETLAAIRPQVTSLVIEERNVNAEVVFLVTIIQQYQATTSPPSLLGFIRGLADDVALQFGFLRRDPRRDVIIEQTTRLLESDLMSWWRNLTNPETLAKRIYKLRSEGQSYNQMSQSLASQYSTSLYSAERLIRLSYNTAANNAHMQDLAAAGFDGKRWLSSRDKRVRRRPRDRFDHKEADGQVRPLNEFFNVSGERLMYPGDRSGGASGGNLFGCRCVVVGVFLS